MLGWVRLGQFGLVYIRLGWVVLGQFMLSQVRLIQVKLGQVGLVQVNLGWMGLVQVSLGQVRLGWVGLGQVRLGWVVLIQVRLGQLSWVKNFLFHFYICIFYLYTELPFINIINFICLFIYCIKQTISNVFNHLNAEIILHYMKKFVSYLTTNTL